MERLLKIGKEKGCEQIEVFSYNESEDDTSIVHGKVDEITTQNKKGYSIRVIRNGKLGFAYSSHISDPRQLIDNALASLQGNINATFDFPHTAKIEKTNFSNKELDETSNTLMVEESKKLYTKIKQMTDAEVIVGVTKSMDSNRLINTANTDLNQSNSHFLSYMVLTYPGGGSAVRKINIGNYFNIPSDHDIKETVNLYNTSKNFVSVQEGKMKVLFSPHSAAIFSNRFNRVFNGKSLYEKTTPIADKLNQKIFSDKITILDDSINDDCLYKMAFDHEGVKKEILPLVKNGVFKNFFNDLNYAQKNNMQPTGHGFRKGDWDNNPITNRPYPKLSHIRIQAGGKTFNELISMIDRGIILLSPVGAHSGNIPNGDYSVGSAPALYVEDGKIIGRAKQAMIAGNIFETLSNVIALENKDHPYAGIKMPSILCDNINVSS